MICILAGAHSHAKKWAYAQQLSDDEWFCPLDETHIYGKENFHVIILDSAADIPSRTFERLYQLAQQRGRINRK